MKHHLLCLFLGLGCPQHSLPQGTHSAFTTYQEVQALMDEAVREGLGSQASLESLFRQVQFQPSVLKAISAPAEQLDWGAYQNIFLTEDRVLGGVRFWNAHQAVLQRAEQIYQVPASIIVAILGVETRYGQRMGTYRVLDSLSTLAFDYPPRSRFFRQELLAFLRLCQEQKLDPLQINGSYAGAMGYPQFMPSAWLNMAVDFDNDGHVDLLQDPEDAIGSIGHFLQKSGWVQGPVVSRALLVGNDYDKELNTQLKTTSTLAHWNTLGLLADTKEHLADTTPANVLKLHGTHGNEYWLAFPNFYVITQYNHSLLYAMAVWQLSQRVQQAVSFSPNPSNKPE